MVPNHHNLHVHNGGFKSCLMTATLGGVASGNDSSEECLWLMIVKAVELVDLIEMRKTDCSGETRLAPHVPSSS